MNIRILSTHTFARIILLAMALAVSLPLTPLLGQSYLDLSDTDYIGFIIAGLKQTIMLWQPGEENAVVGGDVSADGVIMTQGQFDDSLRQIVNNMPQRSINAANPMRGKLGVFWDFQLDFASLPINGSQCDVPCTFSLPATSGRVAPGFIGFTKEETHWRISRIDGLLSFLGAEARLMSAPQRSKAAGLTPSKKRR